MNISDRDFDTARDTTGRDRGTATSASLGDESSDFGGGDLGSGRASAGGRSSGGRGIGDAAQAAGLPHADDLIDELLPEEVDWEHLVRSYPLPALALAAAAGFWLGSTRGPTVLSAMTGWAAGEMTRRVNDLVGQDLL